jgi:hypothetical protein
MNRFVIVTIYPMVIGEKETYRIYDYTKQDYLKTEYTDRNIAEEDCDILNEGNQIELASY